MMPKPAELTLPPVALHRFEFEAHTPVELPPFAGSTWRGVLGHGLKQISCITSAPRCTGCPLLHDCLYAYLFETPPPPDTTKLRRYPAAPHPFVLHSEPGDNHPIPAGERTALTMALVGHANRHLPFITQALRLAAGQGIGRGKGRLFMTGHMSKATGDGATAWRPHAITDIPAHPGPAITAPTEPPEHVELSLETPLRIEENGRPVTPDTLRFHHLFRTLLRRISLLSHFHTDHPLELDFAGLSRASRDIECHHRDLRWLDLKRYSNRQRRPVPISGILGTLTFHGPDLLPFWPYLWHGQWLNAGKGAAMGLGRYALHHSQTSSCTE